MTDNGSPEKVGYGKPPKQTRFKPGTSGNPKGRAPRGGNFGAELLAELAEEHLVRDDGVDRKSTKQRALINTIVTAAIRGNMRAASTIFAFCARAQIVPEPAGDPEPISLDKFEILEAFVERERQRRERQRSKQPDETKTSQRSPAALDPE
jgi:hypothetical protein